jgi:hypothetical protein
MARRPVSDSSNRERAFSFAPRLWNGPSLMRRLWGKCALLRTHSVILTVVAAAVATALSAAQPSSGVSSGAPGSSGGGRSIRLPAIVRGTLHLRSHVIHELRRDLLVQDGTLLIDPGTRVQAAPGTSITISRLGRIVADGTLSRPVIFACDGPSSPGCWKGLVINGAARVNSGTPTSPALAGRDAIGGCLEGSLPGGNYGGCQDNDSSGVLRHVWIENGGGTGGAGLALNGVGARTVLEHIHVFQSNANGLELRGGAARLRHVRIVTADSMALAWNEGWRGLVQYGIVQAKSGAGPAISGGNQFANGDAAPRSAPILRNFTIIGPNTVDVGSRAASIHLHSGTAATLQSFFVLNQPATGAYLLDIDDAATWNRFLNNELKLESSYLVGFAPLGALDDDPVVPGYFSPDVEGQIVEAVTSSNRVVFEFDSLALQLKAPLGSLQDLRPRIPGPLFGASCQPPPGDPFFEVTTLCGGVATGLLPTIPWNEPGPVAPLVPVAPAAPFGFLYVLVASNQIGAIGGVRIRASNFLGVSDVNGYARLYVPSGFVAYTLENLPPACVNPGIFFINVPANGSAGQTALVQCNT